ncbi:SAM-dependent methyltransferase [Poritiphilus flavus]|uniref:SAM-dependent methyltransferase n=1 Tax=Poritiphilus flavus TaxID=2697053 RepID=A0A6L9EFA4_9FLAO|nr:SAM-dependent methyltransferase [Poritiphilus flavus]NAS13361.1 SAM-dependent methyltransferase [Poritiphilus flavus]
MTGFSNDYGELYLIPTTLGDNEPLVVLPISIKRAIEDIDHYIVEHEKSARRFIKKVSPRKSQPGLHIEQLNKFTEAEQIQSFLDPCLEGYPVGILSEAGCPGIADPGAEVVRIAHEKNIRVIPLVGPSSIILGLMASGLNGQNFAFNGYLPIESADRKSAIKQFERISKERQQTQIFIETPYRNDKLLAELLRVLGKHTQLCVAADLTLDSEFVLTRSITEWKSMNLPELHKRPAIFIFQA